MLFLLHKRDHKWSWQAILPYPEILLNSFMFKLVFTYFLQKLKILSVG